MECKRVERKQKRYCWEEGDSEMNERVGKKWQKEEVEDLKGSLWNCRTSVDVEAETAFAMTVGFGERIGFVVVVGELEVAPSEEDSVDLGSNLQLLLASVDEVVPSPIVNSPREVTAGSDQQQLVVPSSLDSPLLVLLLLELTLLVLPLPPA